MGKKGWDEIWADVKKYREHGTPEGRYSDFDPEAYRRDFNLGGDPAFPYEKFPQGNSGFGFGEAVGAEHDLGSFWRWYQSQTGHDPNPLVFQMAAGQSYANNPMLKEVGAYLSGDQFKKNLVTEGEERVKTEGKERRRRTGENLARQGLQGSGIGANIESLSRYQDVKQLSDINRQAEALQLQLKSSFGRESARDMADLWTRMAGGGGFGGGGGGGGGSGWTQVGQGIAAAVPVLLASLL